LALLAICGLLAGRLVDLAPVRERLCRLAETELSDRLDVGVRVGDLDFNFLPLQLEVIDVEIDDRSGERLLDLPRGIARAHLEGLFEPTLTLYKVELERPVIALRFSESGESYLPKLRRRPEDERSGSATVRLRELQVQQGELHLDHLKIPLDLDAEGIVADLVGLGKKATQGDVSIERLAIGVVGGSADLGSVAAKGRTVDGGIEITSATLSGTDLSGDFDGRWSWTDPRPGDFELAVTVDTALLRRLGFVKAPMTGKLGYVGDFSWTGTDWNAEGELTSPALYVVERDLAGLRAAVRADREVIDIASFSARYSGGSVAGSARVELDRRKLVEVDLKLSELDVRRLIEERKLPIRGIATAVSGDLRYRFFLDAPKRGDGWGQFSLQPETPEAPYDLPLVGESAIVIDNGVVAMEAVRLQGASQQIDASGTYHLETKRMQIRYEIETEAPPELFALAALELEPAAWMPATGSGSISGELTVEPGAFASDVNLYLVDVSAPGFEAEELRGGFRIDAAGVHNLRLDLGRRDAGLLLAGRIPFEQEGAQREGAVEPLELAIESVRWPSEQLMAWLPSAVPVEGPVTGTIHLAGSPDALSGDARLTVEPARSGENDLGVIEVEARFDPTGIDLDQLLLTSDECALGASGRVAGEGSALNLEIASEGCRLERTPFAGRLPAGGTGQIALAATVGGTLEAPEVTGRLDLLELGLPGLDPDDLKSGAVDFEWKDTKIELGGGVPGIFEIAGGGLGDSTSADMRFDLELEDLSAVARLFVGTRLEGLGGEARGSVSVRAGLDAESSPTVDVVFDDFAARYRGQEIESLEPIAVGWSPDELTIDSFYLGDADETSDVFISGRALLPEGELELNLQTSLDAEWVELIDLGVDVREGGLDLLANIGGTFAAPRLVGQGSLRDGNIVLPGGVLSLEELEGLLLFYPDQIVLDRLIAKGAGGRILSSGRVGLPTADSPLDYRFQLTARDFSLRYPEGWLLTGDTELVLSSVTGGRQVEGSVDLDRALYSQDVSLGVGQLMQVLFQKNRVEVEEADPFLAETQLNVVVEGGRSLRVRNNLADLYGRIDLAVRGTAARPIVFGEIELERGGTLDYSGTEYTIDRGLLSFVNPYRIEPVIDLTADATTREYEITMSLSGPIDKVNATFASDPPLADLEILSLLATGGAAGSTDGSSGFDAGSFLYGQAASLIADRANNLFGFDKLRIDPLTGESGRLSAARVTVGKQLSRDFFATYSYDPSATEEQILQLEWQVDRDFSLVFTQNGDGTYAVDAQWEKHF